ncbi:hypothetical protein E2P81_ATG03859 [Venturia nashicola]|nr:hypothetical protein E2P81_ATG03859 [Venturia nashicola]
MARRPAKHPRNILRGLDMSAIIDVSEDEANDGETDQLTPPATTRPSRTTRQRVNGEAPALYSARYHPMDDVMRPAAAKRYHSQAFERDEDTDDLEECMTDVGSVDENDQDNFQPVRRKWSTGIRHSGRLDAPSRKPVDYNMKRHPQDAQLRLLEKSSPKKRSEYASFTSTVHQPELLEGDGESSDEEEEGDDGEPPSVGEAPVPTNRVAYSVQHSSGRRSFQLVIDHSDDESSMSDDEDADKENTPPKARMTNVESDAVDGNINAANHFNHHQMLNMEDTPPPANMMVIETAFEDDAPSSKADDTRPSSQNLMIEKSDSPRPPPTRLVEAETDTEEDETSSKVASSSPTIQNKMENSENAPPAPSNAGAETDTEDDEPNSKAGNDIITTQSQTIEKEKPPPATRIADADTGAENDETGSFGKADSVYASTLSASRFTADEVKMNLPAARSNPDANSTQTDDIQKGGFADLESSALESFLDSFVSAAQNDGNQAADAAEETVLASGSLTDSNATQSANRDTSSEDGARLLDSPLPAAECSSSSSSKVDDDILGALLDVTDKVLTSTQHEKVTNLIGMNGTQAQSVLVSAFRLPLPTVEEEGLFAQPAAPQLTRSHLPQVEWPTSSPNLMARTLPTTTPAAGTVSIPFSFARSASTPHPSARAVHTPRPFVTAGTALSPFTRTVSTPNPFARAAPTPSPFVAARTPLSPFARTASTPSPFARTASTSGPFFSSTAQVNQSSVSRQTNASAERIRGFFTPSHASLTGGRSENGFTFSGGTRPATAPSDTGSATNNGSTIVEDLSSGANAPPRRFTPAVHPCPIPGFLINTHPSRLVFGAPSRPVLAITPETESTDDATEEEEEEKEDSDDLDDAYPRYPLSELERDRIRRSRRKSPSSRSSSIRSTNYPHGNPDLEPELPSIPEVSSRASAPVPLPNPLGLSTTTEPDGIERFLPPGFDRYGSSASVFPAPRLPPRTPNSSSFSAGQPLSSPIAEIPRGASGISRPRGAPPPRRVAGSKAIFVLPDAPFSSNGRHLDGEDYESPEEGEEWDKENWEN